MAGTFLTIIYGVFSLGILILVHELGHFIAGKLTGIRVTAFSIGFGRGIFSFDYKGTHYKLGWMPIGGYCRFAGEGEDLKEDRKGEPDEFYERPAWARLITVSAGVFFNFVFGLGIYWVLALSGATYSSTLPRVTVLDQKILRYLSPQTEKMRSAYPAARGGLQNGDLITHVNDKPVASYRELTSEILTRGRETVVLGILRDGKPLTKSIVTGLSRRGAGYINVAGWAPPVLSSVRKESPAAKAGLRVGDRLISVGGEVVQNTHLDLFRLLKKRVSNTNAFRRVRIAYSRYQVLPRTYRLEGKTIQKAFQFFAPMDANRLGCRISFGKPNSMLRDGVELKSVDGEPVHSFSRFRQIVKGLGFDMVVPVVLLNDRVLKIPVSLLRTATNWQPARIGPLSPKNALYRAGIRSGDIIHTINGAPITGVAQLQSTEIKDAGTVAVTVSRRQVQRATILLTKGASSIGVAISPEYHEFRTPPSGVFTALGDAAEDFGLSFSRIVKGITVLFKSGVDFSESTGGPISLIGLSGKVLKNSSFHNWLELLALLSIAIGFMNLLPIPALDGGHIILTIVEIIRRKRMSFKVLHRIQFVGVVILFSLFFFILSLDIFKLKNIF